jgi:hypothetical protein
MLRKRSYLQNPETGLFEGSSSGSGEGSGGLRANDSSRSGGGVVAASKPAKGVLDKVDKAADAARDVIRKVGKSAKTEADDTVKVIGEAGRKSLDNIGKGAKVPENTVEAAKILIKANAEKTAKALDHTLQPEEDKYYHFKANCEAARLGLAGEKAAELFTWGKEQRDVLLGYNTAEESAADARANEAGRHADPSKSCEEAAKDYWGKVLKDNSGGKENKPGNVVSQKTFDLYGTRKKGK